MIKFIIILALSPIFLWSGDIHAGRISCVSSIIFNDDEALANAFVDLYDLDDGQRQLSYVRNSDKKVLRKYETILWSDSLITAYVHWYTPLIRSTISHLISIDRIKGSYKKQIAMLDMLNEKKSKLLVDYGVCKPIETKLF